MKLFYNLALTDDSDSDLESLSFKDPEILQGSIQEIGKALLRQLFALASIQEDKPDLFLKLEKDYMEPFKNINSIYNSDN